MVAYLATLAAVYRVARQDRDIGRWTPWIVPLLFASAAYALFVSFLSPAKTTATLVSVSNLLPSSPFAQRELDIGIYTSRSDPLSLDLEPTTAVFLPRVDPRRTQQVGHWVRSDSASPRFMLKGGHPHVLHTLWGSDIIRFDFEARVSENETGLHIRVQNRTHQPIKSAWLVFNGWLYPIGHIPKSENSSFQLDHTDVVSTNNREAIGGQLTSLPPSELSIWQTALVRAIATYSKKAPLLDNEALLVAVPALTEPVISPGSIDRNTEVFIVLSRLGVSMLHTSAQDDEMDRRHAF
jgi:hypothetical protein